MTIEFKKLNKKDRFERDLYEEKHTQINIHDITLEEKIEEKKELTKENRKLKDKMDILDQQIKIIEQL